MRSGRRGGISVCCNTLQQVEFKFFWVVYTSDGKWNKNNDTRIAKASAILHKLYRSVVIKWVAFKHRKAVSFLISFCSDPRLSPILGND